MLSVKQREGKKDFPKITKQKLDAGGAEKDHFRKGYMRWTERAKRGNEAKRPWK